VRRFTIAPGHIEGQRIAFDRDETRHLARVLRLRPGDVVIAADGRGRDYTVRIDTLGETAAGTVLDVRAGGAESPVAITLVQGVPKGEKMESIVRAATELGVARVVPVIGRRTVVSLDAARWRERARRWQRVAREATKQCGRAVIPDVESPVPLTEWLRSARPSDLDVCFWEQATRGLGAILGGLAGHPAAAQILVGPEGGLEPGEVDAARALGFSVASLGPRVLRTETAGPAIVAIFQARYGDLCKDR
jgi:16S rRNA (uracil1498-N3)-methyltransferase